MANSAQASANWPRGAAAYSPPDPPPFAPPSPRARHRCPADFEPAAGLIRGSICPSKVDGSYRFAGDTCACRAWYSPRSGHGPTDGFRN